MFRPFFRPATSTDIHLNSRDLSPFFELHSRQDGLTFRQLVRRDVSIQAFFWRHHEPYGFCDTKSKSHWSSLYTGRFGWALIGGFCPRQQVVVFPLLLAGPTETHVTRHLAAMAGWIIARQWARQHLSNRRSNASTRRIGSAIFSRRLTIWFIHTEMGLVPAIHARRDLLSTVRSQVRDEEEKEERFVLKNSSNPERQSGREDSHRLTLRGNARF